MNHLGSYDPWLEIDAAAFQHNVREAARLDVVTPAMIAAKRVPVV